MSDIAIKIDKVSKRYSLGERDPYVTLRDILSTPFQKKQNRKEFWALKDISLQIEEGDAIGLIGRNGSGKSTLLKILSRITPPTKGEIRLKGRVSSLLEVGTGFNPELTGRENIFLNGAILGMSKKEIKDKFDEIVDFSGVEKFIDTPVKRYSSGMHVRLAFAVAAHLESEIMLIDEVLAVGDAEFQQKCLGKMNSLAKSGRTVIFVSHNMSNITHLCNKAVLLDSGKVTYSGSANDAVDYYLSSTKTKSKNISLLNIKNREGRGEVKLKHVYWTNERGKVLQHLRTGQKAILNFSYTSKQKELDEVEFGLLIRDSVGRNLTMLHSDHAESKFKKLPGEGIVSCIIDKLPLMSGNYNALVGISVHKQLEDQIELPTYIKIVQGNFYDQGLLNLNPNYQGFFIEQTWRSENE